MRQIIQNLCFLALLLIAGCATLRTGYVQRAIEKPVEIWIDLPEECEPEPCKPSEDKVA